MLLTFRMPSRLSQWRARRVVAARVLVVALVVLLVAIAAVPTSAQENVEGEGGLAHGRGEEGGLGAVEDVSPDIPSVKEPRQEAAGAAETEAPEPPQHELTAEEVERQRKERVAAKEEAALQAGKQDYGSVKEDFLCRACMSLTTAFFDGVLEAMSAKYARYAKGERVRKESMVAEVHEAVDGLCARVKAQHADEMQRVESGETAPTLGGSKKSIYEGIDVACAATLEELNDAFTEAAFRVLMPKTFADTEDELADAADEESAYVLPKAGKFCEQQKLCSPYLHYHITSEQAVNVKREMHAIKGKLKRLRDQEAARASKESSRQPVQEEGGISAGFSEEEKEADAQRWKTARERAKKDAKGFEDEYTDSENEAETTIAFLLSHPAKLFRDAWEALRNSSNDIFTGKFWRLMLSFLLDEAVWFHMSAQGKYMVGGAVAVLCVSFLLALCMLCCCCCCCGTGGGTSSPPHATTPQGRGEAAGSRDAPLAAKKRN